MSPILTGFILLTVLATAALGDCDKSPGDMWPLPERIDISKTQAPKPVRRKTDITVGMWYFPRAEINALRTAPWRTPLLYDSTPGAPETNGIRLARVDDPRVIDWHVYWMTKYGVNLMVWDWYPLRKEGDTMNYAWDINRPLECGFLGKKEMGGAPVATNRFAGVMDFVVMLTNHGRACGPSVPDYMAKQFFSQPNYFKIDGKPWVIFWSNDELINETGSVTNARAYLESIRRAAKNVGLPGAFITTIVGHTGEPTPESIKQANDCGFDGACGYHYTFACGGKATTMTGPDGKDYPARLLDFEKDVRPNHLRVWNLLADAFGKDYIVGTTPMQDWRGGRQQLPVMRGATPEQFGKMLQEAKDTIGKRHLRPIMTVEAWNEIGEGSYVEPSIEYGFGWCEAIAREVLSSK